MSERAIQASGSIKDGHIKITLELGGATLTLDAPREVDGDDFGHLVDNAENCVEQILEYLIAKAEGEVDG